MRLKLSVNLVTWQYCCDLRSAKFHSYCVARHLIILLNMSYIVRRLKNVTSLFSRSVIRRSQSDYILGESDATIRNLHAPYCQHSSENPDKRSRLESTSDTFTCETSVCHCWYA